MRGAAFFDLDGTLLSVNSAGLWLWRERRLGRLRKRHMALAAAYFVGYRLSAIDMEGVIQQASATLAGRSEDALREETHAWWKEEVRPYIAPGARTVLEAHRQAGEPLVLLTSSSEYVGEMAVKDLRLDAALTTRFEVVNGRFTGNLVRPACFGMGKVLHAEAWASRHGVDLAKSAFYTDSLTDLPMLERVGAPRIVNPDPRLRWESRRRGWAIADWRKG